MTPYERERIPKEIASLRADSDGMVDKFEG